MAPEVGYYRHPTIHGDVLVFVCEDDLWRVAAGGGTARRLTANPGTTSFPVLSPDGSLVAFTGRDDGPAEVYVMDAEGGPPRRLTWLGTLTQVVGWAPDGRAVIFASDWRQPFMKSVHLFAVPIDGGPPTPLRHGPATAVSHQPGGSGVAIGRNSGDPARWKRYRGGTAGTIWVDRTGDGDFRPLVRLEGNLANPMWIGARIYFLSDHEGFGNVYSCLPSGRGLRRHTHHEDFYVRFPSTDGRRIVYHAGADLWIYDPETDATREIEARIRSPRTQRNRRFVSASRYLESFDLHPSGHSIASVHRGGLFTMPLWEGAASRHGTQQGVRYRLAHWLPDGERIVAVTDEGDEEKLVLLHVDGSKPPRRMSGDLGRPVELAVAPAGPGWVALANERHEVVLADLRSGRHVTVERSRYGPIEGIAWSPDGRWLAYGFPTSHRTCCIHLCEVVKGRITAITRPDFRDVRPEFDPGGRYLYFISWRVFDPVYDSLYFDLGFPKGSQPFLVTLRCDTVSPFSPATRAPRPPKSMNGVDAAHRLEDRQTGRKGRRAPEVDIDLDGIEDRVVAFPVAEARYGHLVGTPGRVMFTSFPVQGSLNNQWSTTGEPPANGTLESYDFETDKVETLARDVTAVQRSLDGMAIAIRAGNRIRVLSAQMRPEATAPGDKPGRDNGWLDLDRIRVAVVPGDEWRQMFREAWRLQRDQFWTPDMSGVDWGAVRERYLPLVDRVASRNEFSDLMWEMQGELGTSHSYELGGDYLPSPQWMQGLLGADLELDRRTGTWRVARIPHGDSWDAEKCSPLVAPGLNVGESDEILEVDGVPVGLDLSPYELLVNRAGQEVQLTIRTGSRAGPGRRNGRARRPRRGERRMVTVKTLRNEHGLRYRDWVETNREHVHRATRGRVGYLHIPNMGPVGYAEFHRYYLSEVNRDGLIVDVRFNGGGHVSQLVLEKLLRRRVGYGANRWRQPESYPSDAPMGPMVALTNEYAGSDGDIFSHCFKLYELGPLIGKRTWGGVVGIWPRHVLVDGTLTTQPEFASWFADVGWGVENHGTDPDIEVEIRPQDHAAGRDPQMERAVAEIMRILRRTPPRRPDFGNRPRLRPRRLSRPLARRR